MNICDKCIPVIGLFHSSTIWEATSFASACCLYTICNDATTP